MHDTSDQLIEGIAVIGMAGRFPGAESTAAFWDNLAAGLETISTIPRERIPETEPKDDPDYVPRRGLLKDPDCFDAGFFGINPKEAEATDPQQRLFLEECWHALEDAGIDPGRFRGAIGVYAGMSNNSYFQSQVEFNEPLRSQAGPDAVMMGNEKDYLATRVAYKLNLRGPALNIYTACSTSLVSVCQAVAGLQSFQCDVALAGGVSVKFPQERGYLFHDGSIYSPDGHCRAFDEKAQGTVFGCGVGVVALKRLEDALRDGDRVYAVIKGAALNNDGSDKVSFMAPSVNGHAEVISLAHALAGIDPSTIGYVECHGTATPLGDPIEIAGLTQAFRSGGASGRAFCAIGSVKSNIGHLDAAAGVTGLIKAALSLHHKTIPASLHFTRPNPALGLEESPFFVNTTTRPWAGGKTPRRAGISSFGVGGTNAHCVLEEAPPPLAATPCDGEQLLILSAAAPAALDEMRGALAARLEAEPDVSLADVAWSLQTGRAPMAHRLAVVAAAPEEAVRALREPDGKDVFVQHAKSRDVPVAFLFPGQGSQQLRMGAGLCRREPVFAAEFQRCCDVLRPLLGVDLHSIISPSPGNEAEAERMLSQTGITQPALFAVEYALARLLETWGIRPAAMLGHSIGEYVAACLAGVMTLEDALKVVAARGRIMGACQPGAMLAVRLAEADVRSVLPAGIGIASVNSPALTVVSGPHDLIDAFEKSLSAREVSARKLVTSHAFHSAMMEPGLEEFRGVIAGIPLSAPRLPYVSNVTGRFITAEEAVSPDYYVRHIRETVRFSDGVAALTAAGSCILLEAGPGQALAPLAKQNPAAGSAAAVLSLLPPAKAAGEGECHEVMKALGRLWIAGASVDWEALHRGAPRRRVTLPLYPFQRQRYCGETVLPPGTIRVGESSLLAPAQGGRTEGSPAPVTAASDVAAAPALSRLEFLQHELRTQLHKASGIDLAEAPGAASFFDLGFDSLFLTQAGLFLKKHFGVRITFRQLAEDLSSLDALAGYLDRELPAGKFAPAAPVPEIQPGGECTAPVAGRLLNLEREIAALRQDLLQPQESIRRGWRIKAPAHAASNKPAAFGPFRPLQTAKDGSLTEQQRRHLEELIAAYVAKTPGSKAYTQKHRAHFADPRAVSGFNHLWKEAVYPIVTNRSKGSKMWDIDGNEWLDITLGFGPMFLGHSPDFVVEAVQQQLHEGFENGPTSPLAGEVAELMLEFSGMDRVGFCNTGSEAVMAALRMSRTVTGRDKVVTFAGDYHGIFDEVLMRPQVEGGELRSAPIAPGIPESMGDNILVLEYGTAESLEIIREQAHELAAVLVEPVRSRDPGNQPAQFLHDLREITAAAGTALIFDEVVTGFRCHYQGAQGWFGIQADIATYGKVVGGGLPIGMVAGRRRFMDALDGGHWEFGDGSGPEVGVTFFAGTFVRHPLALAAAKAVLLFLKEKGPGLQEELNARTAALVDRLNAVAAECGVPMRYDRFSSLFYPSFSPAVKYTEPFYLEMRRRGIYIWNGRPSFLSIAHSDADLEKVVTAFAESLAALQADGFLPLPDDRAAESAPPAETPPAPCRKEAAAAAAGSVPATPAQLELFLASQVSAEASTACHESLVIRLVGPLDAGALRRSLQLLLERHEALRAGFSADGTVMTWEAASDIALPVVELPALPDGENAQRLDDIERRQFVEPFPLGRGPLMRAALVRMAENEHRLILTAHHLVCDGWSFGVLAGELRAAYSEFVSESGPCLPVAPSFAEFAAAQAAARKAGDFTADRDYWLKQYATVPPPLPLPADRPAMGGPAWDTNGARLRLSADLSGRLKDFCRARRLTPFHVLLTAWEILLHRLCAARDFTIGVPLAGQAAAGLESLCGHCVQFLPIRVEVPPDLTVQELLEATRGQMLDAAEHQNLTLGELLEALPGLSAADRMQFVRAVFSLESLPDPAAGAGLQMIPEPGLKRRALADLMLFAFQHSGGIDLQCTYKTALFEPETIGRWLEHFSVVLDAMLRAPETPVAACPLLSAAQRHELVAVFNDSGCAAFPEACVHELFAAEAARRPDAVAAEFKDLSLTYAELDAASSRLAHVLRSRGIGRDQPVPVFMERSLDLIVAILGILKAGGAYLPIDPGYPAERIAFMLRDSGAGWVLTDAAQEKSMPPGVACLLPAQWNAATVPAGAPPKINTPEDLAYVLYTSGSTGQPKGVPVPHRAVVRLVRDTNFATLDESRVWLLAGALSFDATTLEIWGALLNGGTLAVLPPDEMSLEGIGSAIARHRVTSLWLTAGLFQLMVDERLEDLRGVRELLTGGDVVSLSHAAMVLKSLPDTRLVNGYGPTENTTFSTCHAITTADLRRTSLPIGRPVAHSTCHVLDENGELCPIGVAGELHVGGAGLSRGYWNQPDLTAAKFVDDPFSPHPGAKLYRTGDLVRWLPDGILEFLGRMDAQVKIRGFRIELSEVETALGRHPAVGQVCVVAHGGSAAEKKLAAYVQPAAGAALAPDQLRAFLREAVPDYMIPSTFIPVKEMPVTPNGKLDRKALPDPEQFTPAAADEPVTAPQNETGLALRNIWAEALGLPPEALGLESDFFGLGGTSLIGLKLLLRIREQFRVALPLGSLFRAPTLESFSSVLEQALSGKTSARPISCLQPGGGLPPLFLIHGGDGGAMFYRGLLPRLGPDRPVYAIEAPALTDADMPIEFETIEETAASYLALIRTVQKRGPYLIGGYSFGGVVAYEIARQLMLGGAEAGPVILFDTDNPAATARRYSLMERISVNWQSQHGVGVGGKLLRLGTRLGSGLVQRIRTEAETAAARRLLLKGGSAKDEHLRQVQIREANVAALERYVPAPLDAPVLLLRSDEPGDKYELAADYGWAALVPDLTIETVSGGHLQIFDEPAVGAMAEKVRRFLERRHARRRPSGETAPAPLQHAGLA